MTKEEAKKFGLQLLHGIMERNGSYPVYANNVKQAIEALSEPNGSSETPKDLEEASRKHSCYDEDCEGAWYEPIVRNAFIAGAKWQKEQMMKGAVEGEVYLYHSYNRNATAIVVDIPKENLGDNVRIIICKKRKETTK